MMRTSQATRQAASKLLIAAYEGSHQAQWLMWVLAKSGQIMSLEIGIKWLVIAAGNGNTKAKSVLAELIASELISEEEYRDAVRWSGAVQTMTHLQSHDASLHAA